MTTMSSYKRILFMVLLAIVICGTVCSEEKVEWTPNPNDEGSGGPLPLSQNQRNQLLELEQAIMNAPDPSATLLQVAKSQEMSPNELADLLERNHRDMEQAGAGGGSVGVGGGRIGGWPKVLVNLLVSVGGVLRYSALQHPKSFTIFSTVVLLLLYMALTAPSTGMVLSTKRSLVSGGHTTFWHPPSRYVGKILDAPKFTTSKFISTSVQNRKNREWVELLEEEDVPYKKDGVVVHKLDRKSGFVQSVTAQGTIDVHSLIPPPDDNDDDDEIDLDTDEHTLDRKEEMMDLVYDAAATILSSRRLTEFIDGGEKSLRIQSSEERRQKYALLIVNSLGNFGRYGLVPLKVSIHTDGDKETRLVYSTLSGSHFDGKLSISVQKYRNNKVVVRTNLTIPRKGKRIKSKNLASSIVQSVTQSILRSVEAEVKQTLARQSQGNIFRKKAKSRASERRKIRFEQTKKQEEMAEDRRRKWQRGNQNAGRYTPSGHRQRSPKNC